MKQGGILFWSFSSIALCYLGQANPTRAQIVPDTTLPVNSTVTPAGSTNSIAGGTRGGNNLFHSFKEFSVPTGSTAYFNNSLDVQNIITRVTGRSISNIDGILKANGTANLFLLNPNGIIFGPNASLNIGGSFLASTARAIKLSDGTEFSAIAPNPPSSLLRVNVPIGLQYGSNPGSIVNQSRAIDSSGQIVGLQVLPSKTIVIAGGDVRLDGGTLQASGGRVELGGLRGRGTVGINWDSNNLSLSFPDEVARGDVFLTNGATVDVRAGGGGSIAISVQNLNLAGGSRLLAGIKSGVSAAGNRAGNIEIDATGAVSFDGKDDDKEFTGAYNIVELEAIGEGGSINITADTLSLTNGALVTGSTLGQGSSGNVNIRIANATSIDGSGNINNIFTGIYNRVGVNTAIGNGGNINITTGSLSLTNGGLITASTQGRGNAGNLTILVRNQTVFDGESTEASGQQSSGLYSSVQKTGIGNGGNIHLTTGSLSMRNGSLVIVRTEGQGRAGNIVVNAANLVTIDGLGPDLSSSGLFAPAEEIGTGQGGDITVNTNIFRVSNGAVVNAQTLNNSDGGNITINANRFEATGGGQVITTTRSSGRAGNLTINATEKILLSGSDPRFNQRTPLFDTNIVGRNESPFSGLFASTGKDSTGAGGNLTVQAGQFIIQDGAQATVSANGSGAAGNLRVTADSIRLDNGQISATTSSDFGNIRLQTQSLQLRQGSQITTNGTGSATGGNINIDTGVLAALENSDITANSDTARGGQVFINAQGIFGTEARSLQTANSDITAKGGTPELNGTVDIQTPDINPTSSLLVLPQTPVDVASLIDRRCSTGNPQISRFINVGRGGQPPSPSEPLNSSTGWVDERQIAGSTENPSVLNGDSENTSDRLVEAQGWVINDTGQVELVADAPVVTPYSFWSLTPPCNRGNKAVNQ